MILRALIIVLLALLVTMISDPKTMLMTLVPTKWKNQLLAIDIWLYPPNPEIRILRYGGVFDLRNPGCMVPQRPEDMGVRFFLYRGGGVSPNGNISSSTMVITALLPESNETYPVNLTEKLDPNKRVVFIIHGFRQHWEEMTMMRTAMLKHRHAEIGTVVVVDWKKSANHWNYYQALADGLVVGEQVAELAQHIRHHRRINATKFYIVGFSLGAQIAQYVSKHLRTKYQWRPGRITGLDAAGPGFEKQFLTHEDADFVDAVHTATGVQSLGFRDPYGHVDFYPNGGAFQPGCGLDIRCSHLRAIMLYVASINETCKFYGHPCSSMTFYNLGFCSEWTTVLGYDAELYPKANGSMYLATSEKFPFCDIN